MGAVGGVAGYATIAVDKQGVDDVLDHWNELQDRVSTFFHGTSDSILKFRTHGVQVYMPNSPGFSLIEQQYDTAKAAKDTYDDSKRKGIPVPSDGNNRDETGHTVDPNWKTPRSSYQSFHNDVDRANGCPK